MDIPPCPQDTELRNIIDKLAQFVARNGPDFEQMTKNKQKGNPKFQFLYGGEFFNYYQYKVSSEQHTMLKQQVPNPQPVWQDPPGLETPPHNTTITTAASVVIPPPTIQLQPPIVPVNNNHNPELDQINQQMETLQEQINQSEQNLQAQHTVLLQQQAAQTEVLLAERELADLQREADEHNVILIDLNQLLLPIVDSCTKDSVQAGKSWILQNANSKEKALCIAHCLLMKVMEGAPPFSHRLHVIYLVNDVLHHCARKNAADIKDAFESVVIPMFCSATVAATSDEQRNKLNKLLDLWKSKANYLDGNTVDAMRRPQESLQQYKAAQLAKYNPEITLITQQTQVQFESYRSQHQAFVLHATQQIAEFEQRKAALIEEKILAATAAAALLQQQQIQQQLQQLQQQEAAESLTLSQISTITLPPQLNPTTTNIPTQLNPINTISANINPNSLTQISQLNPNNNLQIPPPQLNMNIPPPHMHQPPPNFFPPPGMFPDFSKPPPGFPPSGVTELPPPPQEELFPSVPYYELPAGLMVPLIKLEDTKFRPIDPADIRLPPPAPPSERLLAAVEAFYTVPSHERPRDSEGWEKLGLYEYYKAKNIARKEKDEQIEAGLREVSRSPSPINLAQERSPSPLRRRYTSCSPPPCASQFQQILPPLSASSVIHSPSPSMSSISSRDVSVKGSRRSRSRSRSRSPPIASSRRRDRDRDREGRGDGRRSSRSSRRRSRSRSHSRSPSPSGFRPSMGGVSAAFQETIDSTNKGHQMLKRMGWGGSGLGVNEQGIDAPISGGDVRDRQDQFKGVGCNMNDPYENFRKNKGAAFITRMKARAEERSQDPK